MKNLITSIAIAFLVLLVLNQHANSQSCIQKCAMKQTTGKTTGIATTGTHFNETTCYYCKGTAPGTSGTAGAAAYCDVTDNNVKCIRADTEPKIKYIIGTVTLVCTNVAAGLEQEATQMNLTPNVEIYRYKCEVSASE